MNVKWAIWTRCPDADFAIIFNCEINITTSILYHKMFLTTCIDNKQWNTISSRINESPYHSAEAFDDVTDTNYVWQDLGPSLYDYLSDNLLVSENSPLIPLSNIDVNGSVSLNLGGRLPVINTDFFMTGN